MPRSLVKPSGSPLLQGLVNNGPTGATTAKPPASSSASAASGNPRVSSSAEGCSDDSFDTMRDTNDTPADNDIPRLVNPDSRDESSSIAAMDVSSAVQAYTAAFDDPLTRDAEAEEKIRALEAELRDIDATLEHRRRTLTSVQQPYEHPAAALLRDTTEITNRIQQERAALANAQRALAAQRASNPTRNTQATVAGTQNGDTRFPERMASFQLLLNEAKYKVAELQQNQSLLKNVDPGISVLPGTSTTREYKVNKPTAPCNRRRATCRKCATIDEYFHKLSAYDDFAQFKASLDNGTEKPIRLTGRGHCKGTRSRCPRFKRKVVYATTSAGNVSKLNWKLENLLPRVHARECKRDSACECDNTDTET